MPQGGALEKHEAGADSPPAGRYRQVDATGSRALNVRTLRNSAVEDTMPISRTPVLLATLVLLWTFAGSAQVARGQPGGTPALKAAEARLELSGAAADPEGPHRGGIRTGACGWPVRPRHAGGDPQVAGLARSGGDGLSGRGRGEGAAGSGGAVRRARH